MQLGQTVQKCAYKVSKVDFELLEKKLEADANGNVRVLDKAPKHLHTLKTCVFCLRKDGRGDTSVIQSDTSVTQNDTSVAQSDTSVTQSDTSVT